jgi:hypothetical protein
MALYVIASGVRLPTEAVLFGLGLVLVPGVGAGVEACSSLL